MNYYSIPNNLPRIGRFIGEVTRLWLATLRRRSQRGRVAWPWKRMQYYARKYLPEPRVLHPYPDQRFRARRKVGAV